MTPPLTDPAGMFERAPELANLAALDDSVRKAVAGGNLHAVYRALWWARLLGRLKEHGPTLDTLLAHRALFVRPAKRSPVLSTMNGVGASVYGSSDRDTDGAYIKTHYLVFVFVPIFPFAQYLVKDAERGWYFLGKVPMSTPVWIWNRLGVAAVFIAVLAGVFQAVHASRYHDVHVVNGLPWPVHATVGEASYDVPPQERRTASVRTGTQPVRVSSVSGQLIESGDVRVEAGTDLVVWNVLGAAPVLERTVVYQKDDGNAGIPDSHLYCGEGTIRRSDVDYAFSEPPATIKMSQGQTAAYRRHVALLPGGLDMCAEAIIGQRQTEAAVKLARGVAALDAEGKQSPLVIGLCTAVGKADEAERLARQALAQHPGSVEHHRLYQSVFEGQGRGSELIETYKARFQAAPDSPDAAYLYARLLPEAEGLALATSFVPRFPDHVGLRRILLYRHLRERRFAEALQSLEVIRAKDRREWTRYVDDHVVALAGAGRVEEARKLAEEAFARTEGPQAQLAGMHAWLSGAPAAVDPLFTRLAGGDPGASLELQVRFWTAPATMNLAALAREPDRALYQLMQHAHFDPKTALKDVLTTRADDLGGLSGEVLILLLAETRVPAEAPARKRLEGAGERYLPVSAVHAYLDQGTWAAPLDRLPLSFHGALHLARSRRDGLPAPERQRLRALARDCDPVGGYVRMALAGWPP
jgi:hypothetical protein